MSIPVLRKWDSLAQVNAKIFFLMGLDVEKQNLQKVLSSFYLLGAKGLNLPLGRTTLCPLFFKNESSGPFNYPDVKQYTLLLYLRKNEVTINLNVNVYTKK